MVILMNIKISCSAELSIKHFYNLGSRARFFKTNDIDSLRFAKISNVNISNTPIFFVEKNGRRVCIAKDSLFFSKKK